MDRVLNVYNHYYQKYVSQMIKSEQLINELKGLYDELEEEMESDFRNPEAFLTEGNRNLLLARINDISIVKVLLYSCIDCFRKSGSMLVPVV